MIIDATNLIIGRIGTVAAKKALLGEEIMIVNCEKAIVTGKKKMVIAKYKQKVEKGIPLRGPYFPRRSDMILRRTIRGMLPWKTTKGREAFKRIKCYLGVPEELKEKKAETIKEADVSKVPNLDYVVLGDISKILGAKQ